MQAENLKSEHTHNENSIKTLSHTEHKHEMNTFRHKIQKSEHTNIKSKTHNAHKIEHPSTNISHETQANQKNRTNRTAKDTSKLSDRQVENRIDYDI